MKKLMLITMLATGMLLYSINSMSDEPKSVTPKEFATAVSEVPSKVSNFLASEVEKTKEFQKKSWADSKIQFANLKSKLSGFFSKFPSGN